MYRSFILFIAFSFSLSFSIKGYSQTPQQVEPLNLQSVHDLIERIAPKKSSNFILDTLKSKDNTETFQLYGKGNKIVLRGSSTQALARGFNWYLNNYCHTSVSWFKSEPVDLPAVLPAVNDTVVKNCRFENRFFLNYCTFGYTTLWWQWDDWERFVDWMALNGINMPLAITGQEYVWQKVWKKFGMTDEETRAFFSGPSHLPWHRMGNLDGWLGQLPQSFINHQFELQKKILGRERSLGMRPILPAFSGHVPYAMKKYHPNLKLTNMGSYTTGDEYNAYFIDVKDPLFIDIQKEFIKQQTELFGTDHLYGIDPFNEMDPPSWEPDYLASVAKVIYQGISEVDKDAVWVQMAWTFYYMRKNWTNPRLEAMIKAVPQGKMLLLDYFCEKTEVWRLTDGFFNAPYVWCYLGNFGGGTQMAAPLKKVATTLSAAENDGNKRNMTGIGSTLEGFGLNRFMFEWLFEYAWDSTAVHTDKWIERYAQTRTGHQDAVAENSWKRLVNLVYNQQVSDVGLGNILETRPRFEGNANYTRIGTRYNYRELANIWTQMLLADKKSLDNPRYQYDLVLTGRQVLVNLLIPLRDKIFKAYKAKDVATFDSSSKLFLDIISDVDKLVSTRPEYSFDNWVRDSHRFAASDAPKSYFEKNAKVLVTTWGPKGNVVTDYAARDWSGLIKQYYLPRWEKFFSITRDCMMTSTNFDQKKFDEDITEMEWNFCEKPYQFNLEKSGNVPDLSLSLLKKYMPYFELFDGM